MKEFVSTAALRALAAAAFVCIIGHAASAQSLPMPWVAQDIGGPALSSTTTFNDGLFTIDAAGNDITGSSDQFHFVHQALPGDVEIVTRIDGLTAVSPWTVAGVMIRSSLAPNAPHAFAAVTPNKGVYFRSRASAGANTSQLTGPTLALPAWLRLVRQGSTVRGFVSSDGATWTSIGSATISVGSTAHVGIAVTSRHSRTRTTAVASNVAVRSIGLPPGQQSMNIGSPAVAGEVLAASGAYAITAAGAGIGGTADQFHLVYQPVTGNTDVIARVASIDSANSWAKAGVTIRESLAAESRHATFVLSRGNGHAFQRRLEPAADTLLTSGGAATAPAWVRIVRTGDLFEAYRSADGVTWTKVAAEVIPMSETVYAGLAATSHSVTAPSTSWIDSFSITATPHTGNRPPAVSIVTPAAGAQFTAPATVTISALASDPENRMLSVDFYADYALISRVPTAPYSTAWSPSTAGTYLLTAVAHDADGASTTSSAVTVEVQAKVNQPPSVSLSTSAGFTALTAPATILLTATASDADGQIARVEFFAGAIRLSTVTQAPYTYEWSNVAAGTYTITAVAYDDEAASASSAPVPVTVQPAPNKIPVVSLSTNGTNFTAPADITLTATASDPDGQVARVEFFAGTTRINTDTTAPYTFGWSSVAAGTYSLTAVAFDNEGASATSAPVTVTVAAPSGPVRSPFGGTMVSLPGMIQAENFDEGGQGVSYYDTDSNLTGSVYRATDVDIEATPDTGGGHSIGWVRPGEWLEYTVQVSTAGTYTLQARVASNGAGGTFHVAANGVNLTGSMSVPNTGAWQTYQTISKAVTLPAGQQVIRLAFDTVGSTGFVGNFNWLAFVRAPAAPSGLSAQVSTGGVTLAWADNSTDETGFVIERQTGTGTFAVLTTVGSNVKTFVDTTVAADTAYGYRVKAINGAAESTYSNIATVTTPRVNKPPVVSLSTNGTNFNAPASITLTVSASDSDGQIARVEFFAGTTRINTDTTAPYTFGWSNVAAGTYTLTAVAYDNEGASATSAPVSVTVHMVTATVDSPRYVAFMASSDHATNVTKYVLKVFASTANPATATPLATSDLGKPTPSTSGEIIVDRATFFGNLAAGAYLATVTAVGPGGETASASVTFTR